LECLILKCSVEKNGVFTITIFRYPMRIVFALVANETNSVLSSNKETGLLRFSEVMMFVARIGVVSGGS
jgi:hypothetical protein